MILLRSPVPSPLAAIGAVLCALSIGLAAYAAHGVADAKAQAALQSACLYGFGHGIALAALAPRARRALGQWALRLLLVGTLLFSGSIAAHHLAGVSSGLAPAGGVAMMLAWLLWAVDVLRR
ncbi:MULTISPECIES: DUF423 domain-containing protein [Pseudoxanthomonas]|uniref:DUF423 domain-containing protein n=1 Tax=Pseudoxanthomonas winnipegensis TaxID=2480810 RepID=A0A4Q8LMQ9_9GAMM|nr:MULTISPECIES: DUF423 domain-containing protein [Pseudoxanthomonas]MDQ1118389.1 uncharacterized membrane protein YgdD (TMEM256/DUF423 family) [Pseudoxanthomonas winnipegensis]MDQ1131573.1 uncharacterized membrane protein YgdD (TMEM256/DUF423 family) [Pseudoxanthomonas winnipegensis]MDR6138412.1 uncharacterized membrane protein YgdD (TMEM256/DUF423 family) [Pseudoxanthomonas sp. SORGH_AS_0997]RZZ86384.1 DUF423 domain-containing protein [Pseudoxanthomonas winnipegensis]TAA31522.1 DUF423 domain